MFFHFIFTGSSPRSNRSNNDHIATIDLSDTENSRESCYHSPRPKFVVGVYPYDTLKFFSGGPNFLPVLRITIYSDDLQTLDNSRFINDVVIDAFMVSKKKTSESWANVDFFPLYLTINILGANRNVLRNREFSGFNINYTFHDLVFVPYCYNRHYLLIILDLKSETITRYDPLQHGLDNQAICDIELFLSFLKNCKTFYPMSKNNLVNINWKISYPSHNRHLQRDGCNCGSFIMSYMEEMAESSFLSKPEQFDPNIHRTRVERFLRQTTISLSKICLGCTRSNLQLRFECTSCRRWVHEMCYKEYFATVNTCRSCKPSNTILPSLPKSLLDIGFENPKNNCWLNSTMQVILRLPFFDVTYWWDLASDDRIIQKLVLLKNNLQNSQINNMDMNLRQVI